MKTPLTSAGLTKALQACRRFEADLSALVDGELAALDADGVRQHVDECPGCRAFVESLSGLSSLHRAMDREQALEDLGAGDLWVDFSRRLVDDTEGRLAKVLYELGRALIATGLRTSANVVSHPVFRKEPGALRSLVRKGRRLARDHARLTHGNRKRSLFSIPEPPDADAAFECGRECLESCLKLDPGHHAARIYLCGYYRTVDDLEEARRQLRILLRSPDVDEPTRLLAAHHLSRVYADAAQFPRAMELEAQVVEGARRAGDELLQAGGLTNLVMYAVKLGRLEEAERCLARLAHDHADRLADLVAPAFRKDREFRRSLVLHPEFLQRVRGRYPALFAG